MAQSSTENLIHCVNPATLEPLATIPVTPSAAIQGVVLNAQLAARNWRRVPLEQRLKFIEQFRQGLYKRAEEVAELITRETGKPLMESLLAEVFSVLETCNWLQKNTAKVLAPQKVRMNKLLMPGKSSYNVFEPVGVVAVVSPWNYPFSIPVATMLTALAAGNAVILKASPKAALIAEEVSELFHRAGFPSGLIGLVQGDRNEAEELILSDVDRVSFTGSTNGGRAIMGLAAKKLIPVTLELGGKHPAIVLKDSDLDAIVKPLVWLAFTNAGQACVSIERLYVEEEIAEALIDKLQAAVAKLRVGNGLTANVDVGPLIDGAQVARIEAQVEDARALGARILTGGRARPDLGGHFYEPTLIAGATPNMKVMSEETFGPLLPVQIVQSAEEAVRLANDSPFGLGASIWTKDLPRAHQLAREIESGMVWINDAMYTHATPDAPWGGIKQSGFGRMHSAAELLDLVYCKNIGVNKQGAQDWNFPYLHSSLDNIRGGMKLLHGSGVCQRLSGVGLVVRSKVRKLFGR
jgi:acyl-CoA reductase-like NAD-dependent aldehyde dehydrogenase